jgi:hypothetical protein
MPSWQGRFQDRHGSEHIEFHSDGSTLQVRIREVDFVGPSFDCLEPVPGQQAHRDVFDLYRGMLSPCTMQWEIPLTVTAGEQAAAGVLHCELLLVTPSAQDPLGAPELHLTLRFGDTRVETHRSNGEFETALEELHRQLPVQTSVKTCITCAWSDYSPLGSNVFGSMGCFRADKDAYRSVRGKHDLFELWSQETPFVQETWLCTEYERRGCGEDTGYRGPFPYPRPTVGPA